MRAAKMGARPPFPLMTAADAPSAQHIQLPCWLFERPHYRSMSLEAKVAYALLLDRFKLSRKNGWVNERGEVFVLFPRRELAEKLGTGEKRATAVFRELTALGLIWEARPGLCAANQIYLARVPEPPLRNGGFDGSGGAGTAAPEPPPPPSNHTKKNQNKKNQPKKVSPSRTGGDGPADGMRPEGGARRDAETGAEELLSAILAACCLESFAPETARVFENAIERLFYSESLRVDKALLPQKRVRSRLLLLNDAILRDVEAKMASNTDRPIKNSTAYTMSMIFNAISESESDLMVDPYLNRLRGP